MPLVLDPSKSGFEKVLRDYQVKALKIVWKDDGGGVTSREVYLQVNKEFDGKKTAIVEKAREVKGEATEMMRTYLGADADALDGFEFLTMAEAGEAGHWSIVEVLAQRARDARTSTLAAWAKPIQERHFQEAIAGSLSLAKNEDPNAPE